MIGFDEEGVDVVEPAIRGFRHEGAGPALKNSAVFHLPLNDRVTDNAHTVRISNPNGTFEKAAFLHPCRTGHFAIAIKREPGCKYRIMILFAARVDDGHTCPCRFSFNNGAVPNGHAWNVCDGIVSSGRTFKWNPQISGAKLAHISPS